MALGVLNNLSAIYAENNLNNTNSSLQKVLQQLSSGSRINSGADDAAGLSLVNGLGANSAALTQSETNATEGVGLLQVADGALSQVTNLLNRAITLATEASNGTLNSTQEGAANQEYQTIMAEINNIGQTTTYNQEQVFNGTEVAIYSGDSSMAGSSIDDLNIRTLSESSVGDTSGKMAYSSGSNSVFVNLSTSTTNASLTDALNASGKTTIDVNYLVKGANGTASTASTTISVGTGTSYANTINGMISAINNAGLGLSANFSTQAGAGVTGGGAETGIQITGGLVSAGVDPSAASTSGTLDLTGLAANATLALGATVSIMQGSNSHTFTIDSTNNTLANLATAITTQAGLGVTASVITNGDGTQSLALADSAPTGGALSATTTAGTTQAPVFAAGTTGTTVLVQTQGTQVSGNAYVASTASHDTVGTGSGTELGTDILTEGTQLTITNSNFAPNGTQAFTFIVGQGTNVIGAHASTYYTGNTDAGAPGTTLQGLADAVNAVTGTLGASASVGTGGLTVTASSAATAENMSVTGNTLTSSTTGTQLGLYSPTVQGDTLVAGTSAVTTLDNGAATAVAGDTLTGSITLNNSYGAFTFTAGAGTDGGGTYYLANHGGNTYTGLVAAITAAGSGNTGYTAAFDAAVGAAGGGGVVLTATAHGINPITVSANTLADTTNVGAVGADAGGVGLGTPTNGTNHVVATSSTAIMQLSSGALTDSLAGAIKLTFNGNNQIFIMGSQPINGTSVAGAIYTGSNTVTSLVNAINSAGTLALTATAPGGGSNAIYLQGTGVGQSITMSALTAGIETALAVYTGTSTSGYAAGATGAVGNNAVDNLTAENNLSVGTAVNTNDVMSGHITVVNGAVTDTFNIGTGADAYSAGTGTYYTHNTNATVGTGLPGALENYGSTLAGLASAISAESATLGLTAVANASGLTFTQTGTTGTYTGVALSTSANTLTDVTAGTYSTSTTSNQLANESDTLSGALVFNVGSNATQTVTMANVTGALDAGTVTGMIKYINDNSGSLGVSAAWVPAGGSSTFGSIQLTSGTEGSTGTVTVSSALTSLTDTTTGSALSYTSNSAYSTGLSGSITDSTTTAGATYASDNKASSGVATISYTDGAGVSLSSTDLSNQTNAQNALTSLNSAITAVAAQDGYIGAQINTLNAVSQVLTTQSENVKSAQNAVQATDYASAASNMSKYEILSQTGIAALAQANSVQQEVTKLLQ
jgi:flagellin